MLNHPFKILSSYNYIYCQYKISKQVHLNVAIFEFFLQIHENKFGFKTSSTPLEVIN